MLRPCGWGCLAGGSHEAPQVDGRDWNPLGCLGGLPHLGRYPFGGDVGEHFWGEIRFLGRSASLGRLFIIGDPGQLSRREGRWPTGRLGEGLIGWLSLS